MLGRLAKNMTARTSLRQEIAGARTEITGKGPIQRVKCHAEANALLLSGDRYNNDNRNRVLSLRNN